MFCKNCGAQLNENAAFCVNCGAAVGQGNSHCANCGGTVAPGAAICLNCGVVLNGPTVNAASKAGTGAPKSKVAAGLLGIFSAVLVYTTSILGIPVKLLLRC